jgi:hypothetical protein
VLTDAEERGGFRPEATVRLSRYCGDAAAVGAAGAASDAAAAARAPCVTDEEGFTRFAVPLLELGPWSWSRISFKARAKRARWHAISVFLR